MKPGDERVFEWPQWNQTPRTLVDAVESYPVPFQVTVAKGSATALPESPAFSPALPPPVPSPVQKAPDPPPSAPPPGPVAPDVEYVNVGGTVKLAATADGTPPFSFQWKKDGLPLAGQVRAELSLIAVSPADAGVYVCVVTNRAGAQVSPPVKLVVRER